MKQVVVNGIRRAEMMAVIQLRTHQILKLLFAQKESAPTASPISIIIFQDQSPQEDRKETYDVVTSHGQRYNICTPDFYQ